MMEIITSIVAGIGVTLAGGAIIALVKMNATVSVHERLFGIFEKRFDLIEKKLDIAIYRQTHKIEEENG